MMTPREEMGLLLRSVHVFVAITALLVAPTVSAKLGVTPLRIDAPVQLDGRADEAFWSVAPALEGFEVFEPKTGLAPRFGSRGKIVYDREAIIIYVEVDVGEADLFLPMATRDSTPSADRIMVWLDTQGLGRRAYAFSVSASGVLFDGLRQGGAAHRNGYDRSWDSLFDAAVHRGEDRWSVEIRIPFMSLRFDPAQERWGLHVFASSWKHQQDMSWVSIDRDVQNRVGQAAELRLPEEREPGRDLELLPSVTLSWFETREDGSPLCEFGASPGSFEICGALLDYGLGLKWAVSPGVSLDVVANPDFSQVEADPAELTVNNRFAIYLEERRPFFLEGKDIYKSPLKLFYSRSISAPEVAVKLTKAGGTVRYGLLYARDAAPPDSVLDDGFSVSERDNGDQYYGTTSAARVQWDLSKKTNLGVIFLDRGLLRANKGLYVEGAPRGASNQVFGLDGQSFVTQQLKAHVGAYVSQSSDLDGQALDGHAVISKLTYREDAWRLMADFERMTQGFRSEAGYLPREGGYNNFFVKLDGYHRSENPWAREVSPGIWTGIYVGDDGVVSERKYGVNTYWRFGPRIWLVPVYERVAERIDGVWLDTNRFKFFTGFETFRSFDVQIGFRAGDEIVRSDELLEEGEAPYVGASFEPELEINLRPMSQLSMSLAARQRIIWDAVDGSELANDPIARLSTRWFFSRAFDVRGIVEWDDLGGVLTGDFLMSYEPQPGTVAYLGYRHGGRLAGEGPRLEERAFFMKLSLLNLL
jgi:hypothetical protein